MTPAEAAELIVLIVAVIAIPLYWTIMRMHAKEMGYPKDTFKEGCTIYTLYVFVILIIMHFVFGYFSRNNTSGHHQEETRQYNHEAQARGFRGV